MIDELTGKIEAGLQSLDLPGHLPEIYEPVSYSLRSGAKRIRPLCLMLSAALFGKKPDEAINQAVAVELFHNFTLVHDDIMDKASLRRGSLPVYKKWGQNTAILSGDIMFSLAIRELSKCEAGILPGILSCFADTAIRVCEGQQLDMNAESTDSLPVSGYLEMIGLKTACLLAASLKIGALLGKAGHEAAGKMYEFGLKSGLAFQLIDDYLDAFGDEGKTGKERGGDIHCGKKSVLHILTVNRLGKNDRASYLEAFAGDRLGRREKFELIMKYYLKCEAGPEVLRMAEELSSEGEGILNGVKGDERAKEELITLTRQLIKREK